MNLTEFLQKISYGPLAELPIGGEGGGTVPEAQIPRLILPLGAALTDLYTRFSLRRSTLTIGAVDGLSTYPLREEFAQTSSSSEINKFILDSVAEPFLGNVLMVTDVFDHCHEPLPLNDRTDKCSWFTSEFDVLRMDYPRFSDYYHVDYLADHDALPLVPADTDLVQIRIPRQLELALLAHVAAAVYSSMSIESAIGKAKLNRDVYEEQCRWHEERNTFNSSRESTNTKPELGGWNR